MSEVKITKDDVIRFIEEMSVLELSQLVKELEQKFGVTAAAPVVAGPVQSAAAVAEAPAQKVEEKTEFKVILTGYGADKKIPVLKEVRAITGLGLKEAKDLVEKLPADIKDGLTKEAAQSIKEQLEKAGATVEIK